MLFPEKKVLLKNNQTAILRNAEPSDAHEVIDCLRICTTETDFLLRYPEECNETDEQESIFLQTVKQSPLSLMLLAVIDGEIVGNCIINIQKRIKASHRASVAISVRKKYWGLGLGSKMFEELIAVAKKSNCTMLELEFAEGNTRAQSLYEKMGFTIFAELKKALKLHDGTYKSLFYMVKYL